MATYIQQDDFLIGYGTRQCDSIAIGDTDSLNVLDSTGWGCQAACTVGAESDIR